MLDVQELIWRQNLPLEDKEIMTLDKIMIWYEHWKGKVYVSFSGGKDSTVLLHLVRKLYPDVPAVFIDTGLEFPEIKDFVRTIDNVIWLKPKMHFTEVIKKYGYPIINKDQACAISRYRNTKRPEQRYYRLNGFPNGKKGMISKKWQYLITAPFKISDYCCDIMKKGPLDRYAKKTDRVPMIGSMASDSRMRKIAYLKVGCNAFNLKKAKSTPIGFWIEEDIWKYIKKYKLPYSHIYDMGYNRTGCVFCAFGVHMEKGENRFQKLKKTHPELHYYCINKLGMGEVLDYINVEYGKEE